MDNETKELVGLAAVVGIVGLLTTVMILGLGYLFWVLLSWGLISVVVAFGGTVGLSAWALAVPLWLTAVVLGKVFSRGGQ